MLPKLSHKISFLPRILLSLVMIFSVNSLETNEIKHLISKVKVFQILCAEFIQDKTHITIAIVTTSKPEFMVFKKEIDNITQSKFRDLKAKIVWYPQSPKKGDPVDVAYYLNKGSFNDFSKNCLSFVNNYEDFERGSVISFIISGTRPIIYINQRRFIEAKFTLKPSIRKIVTFVRGIQ